MSYRRTLLSIPKDDGKSLMLGFHWDHAFHALHVLEKREGRRGSQGRIQGGGGGGGVVYAHKTVWLNTTHGTMEQFVTRYHGEHTGN